MSEPKKIDRVDAVEVLFPVEGPYTAETVVAAAGAIAWLWRYLAHATLNSASDALGGPADVYLAIGSLTSASRSAEQVLGQLVRWAVRLARTPGLTHDEYKADDPEARDAAVTAAVLAEYYLHNAGTSTSFVARDLDKVSAALGHLYIASADGGDEE
ncbi:hypothetical protein IU500_34355 [Nocardia terpenica]|uniref:hypothetical protein n=1 Tax=Nocardia terpenica TaxID=455432 RepID=UPI0018935E75|nr:hypothetical protein [Nocardia terpenica]MBF6065417.1 hypothetical protein [Nocardia terpenica]MBF6109099.1 hypothetical protein [Nocardia terpenica]MBF6114699.1 hypothetical protein [Nocardia terpenica]MBF6123384.1 hypothetical protein [Nocardia terpenica]MBF6156598.1 hypothetical protein [Nocardia terpenica]